MGACRARMPPTMAVSTTASPRSIGAILLIARRCIDRRPGLERERALVRIPKVRVIVGCPLEALGDLSATADEQQAGMDEGQRDQRT
jgi:hypothetical protein